MKKIEALIKPFKFQAVKQALLQAGFPGMTISEVRGCGRQYGQNELYHQATPELDFVAKLKIEIIVADDQVESIVHTIEKSAHTGRIGDGKIFIYPVEKVVRIRTGETNESAI